MSQVSYSSQIAASQSNSPKHLVLLDTDIGDDIDDALALAHVLRSPEIEVKAVTTVFGDTRKGGHLAAHILQTFGREDIQVAAGLDVPLQPHHRSSGVPQAAILNACTAPPSLSSYSAPELIFQEAMSQQGRLTLFSLVPLPISAVAPTIEHDLSM